MEAQIRTFLNCLRVEKGLAENTILAYRRDIVKFEAFCSSRKLTAPREIQRGDVVDFLASLYRAGLGVLVARAAKEGERDPIELLAHELGAMGGRLHRAA